MGLHSTLTYTSELILCLTITLSKPLPQTNLTRASYNNSLKLALTPISHIHHHIRWVRKTPSHTVSFFASNGYAVTRTTQEMALIALPKPRNYRRTAIDRALSRVNAILREAAIQPPDGAESNKKVIPLILAFNSINCRVKKILTNNFSLLQSDPETSGIFNNLRVPGAFRRDTNLKDSLVHSSLKTNVNKGGVRK